MKEQITRLRGITRIELITLLTIACLLLSITIPSLSAAKKEERSALCQS